MTDKTADPKQDKTAEGNGITSIFLVIVAIVAIVGLYALARMRTDAQGPQELPLLSIQIEFDSLTPEVRQEIAKLERRLVENLDVFGPLEQKYLVPGATPGTVPQLRAFDQISDDDWAKAWPYFAVGDWLVPRIFRIDGKACVLRVAPKDGARQFLEGTRKDVEAKIENAIASGKFKSIRAYSSGLGLGGQPERDALNVTFGTSTAWVKISRSANAQDNAVNWESVDGEKLLDKIKPAFSHNTHIRSIATPLAWLKYFEAVRTQKTGDPAVPDQVPPIQQAFTFARSNQIQSHMTQNGDEALVAVTSDLEGKDNLELYYYMASVLQEELKVNVKGPAWKLPNGPAPATSPKD